MGKTATSNMTAKSKKSQKDSEQQKLIASKMQDISAFNGEPPEPEILLEILERGSFKKKDNMRCNKHD